MRPRILIAEDEPAIRMMLARMAQIAGIEATTVGNGRAALEELRRTPYDVLLLDLTMPEVSGYDVARELRSWPDRPAVIAITANGREDGRDLDGAVVQCILKKPFDMRVLLDMLLAVGEAVHGARARGTWTPPRPDEPSGDGLR